MSVKREVITQWYKALETGDLELFRLLHHADVIYDISGHSAISGRHEGLSVLFEKVLPVVFGAINTEAFRFCEKVKIMAEDEHCIVGNMEADGEAANGKRYDQRYAHFFEFRDDKISRVIEFFDTALAQDVLFVNTPTIEPSGPFQL